MGEVIWLTASFLVVAIVASLGYAATRGWRLWRTFRRTTGRLTDAMGRVAATAAEAEQHAVGLSAGSERLAAASERLQRSLAELGVLRAAAKESRAAWSSLRGTMPRK
jgi:hypothetical protein